MQPVVQFIDGDTLEVLIDGVSNRIRIYRADTPETQNEKHCGGAEATAFAEWALSWNDNDDVVYLERDRNARDRYGRKLAYVWFEVDGNPYMLNHVLINNGWAEDRDYGDRLYDQELKDAAAFADRHDLGVWSLCGGFKRPLTAAPVVDSSTEPQVPLAPQPSQPGPAAIDPTATPPQGPTEVVTPSVTSTVELSPPRRQRRTRRRHQYLDLNVIRTTPPASRYIRLTSTVRTSTSSPYR